MDFYVGLLQELQDPDADFYAISPHFKAVDGTKYWFNCAKQFMDVRFGSRKTGVSHGDSLTLHEIRKVQKISYQTGGNVTRFVEYDRDAASMDDRKSSENE